MTTSFRTSFVVVKRNMGYWSEGQYIPDDNTGQQISVMATVQMPSSLDMGRIEATAFGRRATRYIKIYTDTRLQCVNQHVEGFRSTTPGDIFYYDGSAYILFGESDYTMLSRSRNTQVSHWRYYACELIEGYQLENGP